MKNLKLITALFTLAFLTSCVNDDYNDPDLSGACTDLTSNKRVQDIAADASTTLTQYVDADPTPDIIEAYVTSSDKGGNFYKSISCVSVDGTTGFSIPIDDYNLYTKFEPGRKIYLNMTDKYFVRENDALLIGALYNNGTPTVLTDDEVGRFSPVEYQSQITRSCTKVDESTITNTFTIAQAKNNQNLNKLIELNNVQFVDASLGKNYYDANNDLGGATNHTIEDVTGNTIVVRTSSFANFAARKIPSETCKIKGVLTKFGSTFQFMIRTIEDVTITGDRLLPAVSQSFTTGFGSWQAISVSGAQIWTIDQSNGNPGPCASMNGFASGNNNLNEDWLISPSIDLVGASGSRLIFSTAKNFNGNALQVYVSTNYDDGDNVNNTSQVNWTLLSATFSTASNYVWTSSGNVSLLPYIGNPNVRIAFKYTSTTSASAAWRLDGIKVFKY